MKKKIAACVLFTFLAVLFLVCFLHPDKVKNKDKTEITLTQEQDGNDTELKIDTYEDLQKEKSDRAEKKDESSLQSENSSTDTKSTDTKEKNSKVKVIDESDETMKDETVEKEYVSEPQGKIKLHKPKQEEGKEVDGDIKAGGEQNVGTWD